MFVQFTHDRAEGCKPNEYRIMKTVYEDPNGRVLSETMVCKVIESHSAPGLIINAMNRIYGGWQDDSKTPR